MTTPHDWEAEHERELEDVKKAALAHYWQGFEACADAMIDLLKLERDTIVNAPGGREHEVRWYNRVISRIGTGMAEILERRG